MKLLYYDRIDVSQSIDVNKTSESKECIIYHYRYFLDKGFKFQPDACNGSHHVSTMSMSLSNFAIVNIHDVGYCCIIIGISKSEAMGLLKNENLNEKSGIL